MLLTHFVLFNRKLNSINTFRVKIRESYTMEGLTMTSFGTRLRSLRKTKTSLTMKELGKKIGVSESAVGMYERGDREPDMEVVGKIADIFDVSVDYLLGRTEVTKEHNVAKTDNQEFEAFANDPSLQKWYKELPASKEEDLRKLRQMWEILRNDKKI